MNFKLKKDEKYIFATDLDGTFLTSCNNSMHIDNYRAVNLVKEKGHKFIITTGRSWWWAKKIYDQVGSIDASIHFSGAQIYHSKDNGFSHYRNSIKISEVFDIENEINFIENSDFVSIVGRKYQAQFNTKSDLTKLFFNAYEIVISIKKFNNKAKLFYENCIKKYGDKYSIRYWKYEKNSDIEAEIIFSPKGTSKAFALKYISDYYNIPRSNIIYFGDNVNDIEALEFAGYSYAVNNATPEAKKCSNEVLDLNNNNGAVAKKIIELLEK